MRLVEEHLSLTAARSVKVLSMVRDALERSPYRSLRGVSCEFSEGLLLLRGRLGSYYHKQLAQEAVADVEGVLEVVNKIEVVETCRR
jgi:osmotically-inducible protein OsmY